MAAANYKQVIFPLLEATTITDPPPSEPDPLARIRFGLADFGSGLKLYIWHDGIGWEEPTLEELIQNVPNFITNPTNVFYSETDSNGDLIDLRFLNKGVLIIEADGTLFYEGVEFNKANDSDTIEMVLPNALIPNTPYIVTTSKIF